MTGTSHFVSKKEDDSDFYSKTNKMYYCIKFILFWNDSLHVSDGPSSAVQDCTYSNSQTDTAVCLLASRQQRLLVHLVGFTIEIVILECTAL